MFSLVLGFATRYLPDVFKFIAGKVTEKSDREAEESLIRLQNELEDKRAAREGATTQANAEITMAITALQSEVEAVRANMEDRSSARKYGTKAISLMDATLGKGKELGCHWGFLVFGWYMVLFVEMLSAIVQPGIAITVFVMWAVAKFKMTGGFVWSANDWALMEAIVGFYLAGRVKKGQAAKKHLGAGQDAKQ